MRGVTIWRARPAPGFTIQHAAPRLSAEERGRIGEIGASEHARAFAFRRAARRSLIAHHLDIAETDLTINTAPDGKPSLAAPHDALRFSAATAGSWLVLAAAEAPLGLDAEPVGRRAGWATLAPKLLSAEERRDWDEENPDDLLTLWTAKEAVIKAAGGGLTVERLGRIAIGAADASGWQAAREGNDVWALRILNPWRDLKTALALQEPAEVRVANAAPILARAGLPAES